MVEYVDNNRKAKKKEATVSDDEEPPKRPDNKMITGVIDAIHAVTSKDDLTKKALRVPSRRRNATHKHFQWRSCQLRHSRKKERT